jgi:cytidine deaminase
MTDQPSSPESPAGAGSLTPEGSSRQDGVIDWAALRAAADAAATRAYAPYSKLHVGAAALADDGRLVVGCNVENISYGLTLCAECGLVSALAASGGGYLVALSVTAGDGLPLSPCGRCRQVLYEHGGNDLLIDQGPQAPPLTLADVLPHAFGPDDVTTRRKAP